MDSELSTLASTSGTFRPRPLKIENSSFSHVEDLFGHRISGAATSSGHSFRQHASSSAGQYSQHSGVEAAESVGGTHPTRGSSASRGPLTPNTHHTPTSTSRGRSSRPNWNTSTHVNRSGHSTPQSRAASPGEFGPPLSPAAKAALGGRPDNAEWHRHYGCGSPRLARTRSIVEADIRHDLHLDDRVFGDVQFLPARPRVDSFADRAPPAWASPRAQSYSPRERNFKHRRKAKDLVAHGYPSYNDRYRVKWLQRLDAESRDHRVLRPMVLNDHENSSAQRSRHHVKGHGTTCFCPFCMQDKYADVEPRYLRSMYSPSSPARLRGRTMSDDGAGSSSMQQRGGRTSPLPSAMSRSRSAEYTKRREATKPRLEPSREMKREGTKQPANSVVREGRDAGPARRPSLVSPAMNDSRSPSPRSGTANDTTNASSRRAPNTSGISDRLARLALPRGHPHEIRSTTVANAQQADASSATKKKQRPIVRKKDVAHSGSRGGLLSPPMANSSIDTSGDHRSRRRRLTTRLDAKYPQVPSGSPHPTYTSFTVHGGSTPFYGQSAHRQHNGSPQLATGRPAPRDGYDSTPSAYYAPSPMYPSHLGGTAAQQPGGRRHGGSMGSALESLMSAGRAVTSPQPFHDESPPRLNVNRAVPHAGDVGAQQHAPPSDEGSGSTSTSVALHDMLESSQYGNRPGPARPPRLDISAVANGNTKPKSVLPSREVPLSPKFQQPPMSPRQKALSAVLAQHDAVSSAGAPSRSTVKAPWDASCPESPRQTEARFRPKFKDYDHNEDARAYSPRARALAALHHHGTHVPPEAVTHFADEDDLLASTEVSPLSHGSPPPFGGVHRDLGSPAAPSESDTSPRRLLEGADADDAGLYGGYV